MSYVPIQKASGAPLKPKSFAALGESLRAAGATDVYLPLTHAANSDGTPIVATGPAGNNFIFDVAAATKVRLKGPDTQNTTKASVAVFEAALPPHYTSGQDVSVKVNAELEGAGTAGATKTVDVNAYNVLSTGATGADLCETAAQAIAAAAADYTFNIDGATLVAGGRIVLVVTLNIQESGNVSPINGQLNSVRIQ